jgi:phosphonopyruvate decarboxylase
MKTVCQLRIFLVWYFKMIQPKDFIKELEYQGSSFFCGVPDSLLKQFCNGLDEIVSKENHQITANEGGAIALASGYQMATGTIPVVYIQNSGQGNAVNPLLSLADPEVYSIPIVLIIGWRGEPGYHDEPQHIKQGKVTTALLDTMEIPYCVLSGEDANWKERVKKIYRTARLKSCPVAIIISRNSFDKYSRQSVRSSYEINREKAIRAVTSLLDSDDIVVSTTGHISRELYTYRKESLGECRDFLTVGSMGHASQIALGIAIAKPKRNIYCYDGDGAFLMHLGAIAISGTSGCTNFRHIVFNNGVHGSVGGQPTVGFAVSFTNIADQCGYSVLPIVSVYNDISEKMMLLKQMEGPAFLEIRVANAVRKDLIRPIESPLENKKAFIGKLSD